MHMAIRRERGHSLHMVDFLVENSSGLDTATIDGNTALHYCAIYNQPECAKLLLRSGANMNAENKERKTVADLAKEFGSSECEDLVISSRGHTPGVEKKTTLNVCSILQIAQACQHKKTMLENVNIDWNLSQDEAGSIDLSDEDTVIDNTMVS